MSTGDTIITIAMPHVGEVYRFGARAPLTNTNWTGPWDCAEFASWCVYQAASIVYGAEPVRDPSRADPWSGFWAAHAERDDATIAIDDAARITGAVLVRKPADQRSGHIAISLGDGRTVEAHSTREGVKIAGVSGRRWDYGVLVPGIEYHMAEDVVVVQPPAAGILRVTSPMTRGERVRRVQEQLERLGYAPGAIDGVYGPQTAAEVREFQAANGLVADGEVGPATLERLTAIQNAGAEGP